MADVEKLRKVKQCIDSLAEGLNPFTGQPLPEEDVVNDVRVSRSLFLASAFLQEQMQGTPAKKNGKKQALENFETLHPVQQMLLLEMFFQRRFTCNLKVNASEVVTLVRYGYLSREGMVTLDSNGDPCVNTTLTPQTIRLMQENREHMQEIRSKLAQDGVGGLPD